MSPSSGGSGETTKGCYIWGLRPAEGKALDETNMVRFRAAAEVSEMVSRPRQHPGATSWAGWGWGGGSRRTGPGPGCRTFSGFRGERHPALFRSKRRLLPLKRDKAEQHQENIRLDCHRGAGHAPLPGFRLALASLAPHLDLLTCRGCPTHGSACPLFILLGCLSCWLLFLEDRKRGREVEREKRD